jgi:hypothetical protein
VSSRSIQRSVRNAARSSSGKKLRLFPGGEVAAPFGFGPAARRGDIFLREHRDRGREGNVGGGVEVLTSYGLLPVQPRCGCRCIGEPVQRAVVEPVVASDGAVGVSGEEVGEVLVGGLVVVKEPGREADGCVSRRGRRCGCDRGCRAEASAKLTWMPSSPSGSWRAIAAEIAVPQSPPWVT